MKTNTKTKPSIVSIKDISLSDLLEIIDLTEKLKSNPLLKHDFLNNKSIALIFAKPSLRTRISFEIGIKQLGGHPLIIKMEEISVGIRENVEDIAHVLSRYVDAIVIRTYEQKQIEDLRRFSTIPVINALSNEEHPCQVISDLFTIHEIFKTLSGLKLTYIGDGNNVAHSLLLGCSIANMNISIASPKNHSVSNLYIEAAKKTNPDIKVEILEDPKQAAKDANILYTDVWTSMGHEKEQVKRKKIFAPYQLNEEIVSYADKNAIVLHCLPAHKGEEITKNVFDKFSEIIYTQAENRLHTQKAIILKLLKN